MRHLDFGMNDMGFASDWRKMAYVLREGETSAPAGLQRAMANTNALQDTMARLSRPGKAAGEVHAETMAEMAAAGGPATWAMMYIRPDTNTPNTTTRGDPCAIDDRLCGPHRHLTA